MRDILHKDSLFFENLFRQNYKPLKAYAFKFVNDLGVAEDVVQDVFFEMWLKREKILIQQHLRAYLFKSVSNKSINYLKAKKENVPLTTSNYASNLPQDFYLRTLANDDEDYTLLNDLNNEIKLCVEKLPDYCKKIFILRHEHNLQNKEIAEQLNITVKAVEKQITKALMEIKNHLTRIDILPFVIFIIIKKLSE